MIQFDRKLLPPETFQIMNYSEANFTAIGKNHLDYFISKGGLKPTDSVLEIGSGNGRIASALAGYLTSGNYVGLDIMKSFVKWCQETYKGYNNFSFRHINVFNKAYNRFSFTKAKNYKFNFDDNSFDFIFLTSVFTHMHEADIANYLGEISRMLKPGGRVFITYFLVNEQTLKNISKGTTTRKFVKYIDNAYTDNPRTPESAIGHAEEYVYKLYEKNGLAVDDVSYGKWRSPKELKHINHNQDRVLAIKS